MVYKTVQIERTSKPNPVWVLQFSDGSWMTLLASFDLKAVKRQIDMLVQCKKKAIVRKAPLVKKMSIGIYVEQGKGSRK